MRKKVAIYLRVSTSHQRTDLQKDHLTTYSEQRGFEVFKYYSDTISGTKEKRPALDQLMMDARKRLFDIVLVFRFDRAARSSRHLTNLLEEFNSLGIDFISYQESIDTSSPMGKAMFTIISAMAQLERDIIKERVLAGLATARKKGTVLGRPKKRDDQKICELRSQGLSYRAIRSKLGVSISSIQAALKSTQDNKS